MPSMPSPSSPTPEECAEHRLVTAYTSGLFLPMGPENLGIIGERCLDCEFRHERAMTPEERKKWAHHQLDEALYSAEIHSALWKFCKKFQTKNGEWRWEGYEMLERLDKYASKHPEILLVPCDDHTHSSSTIVLIPHEAVTEYEGRDKHWGLTVVVVPQMGRPCEFFLYPNETRMLMDKLTRVLGAQQTAEG